MEPKLILINPWIYDFAAYDLWSKPLGLLSLAGDLRNCGFKIHLIDCLDVHHPEMKESPSMTKPVRRPYGTGKFRREKVPKPTPLKNIPRSYSRYGIPVQLFRKELKKINGADAILVTSLMTYWYPGVKKVITIAREIHPDLPVILGGIYARLCRQHALQVSGADFVVGEEGLHGPGSALNAILGCGIPKPGPSYPAFDMLHKIDYICLLTSSGCPYRCRYCASPFLNTKFSRRNPLEVLEEILHWHRKYGVQDFAFYDDALLLEPHAHMSILLENLIGLDLNLRFHTPNALHVREISPDMARLLFLSGFRTIRLGLETSDMDLHKDLDNKVSEGEFERAVDNLKKAGFNNKEIGAYILAGLPGQSVDSVVDTIRFVARAGATPYLAEYSPIPHTPMWKEALSYSTHDLSSEPLFHNNSLFPCWDDCKRARVPELKKMVQEIRQN